MVENNNQNQLKAEAMLILSSNNVVDVNDIKVATSTTQSTLNAKPLKSNKQVTRVTYKRPSYMHYIEYA